MITTIAITLAVMLLFVAVISWVFSRKSVSSEITRRAEQLDIETLHPKYGDKPCGCMALTQLGMLRRYEQRAFNK
jgi:hypothetical protein